MGFRVKLTQKPFSVAFCEGEKPTTLHARYPGARIQHTARPVVARRGRWSATRNFFPKGRVRVGEQRARASPMRKEATMRLHLPNSSIDPVTVAAATFLALGLVGAMAALLAR